MLILRRELFGGIIGRRDKYGFHVVNRAGFAFIESLRDPNMERRRDLIAREMEAGDFVAKLKGLGYLDEGTQFQGEVIDNGNRVSHLSAPIRVWVEVTARCNLSCRECFNENHQAFKGDLPLHRIKRILDDLHSAGVLQLTITGGEPLLRRDIWDILDHASGHGFGLRFFSNGTTLNEANAERLSHYPISHVFVSLDGIGPANDVLRGSGTYARISKRIERLGMLRNRVTLSVTLHRYSLRTIDELFSFAEQHGIRSLLIRPLLQYSDTANSLMIPRECFPALLETLDEASASHGVEYQLNKLPFYGKRKSIYLYDAPSDIHFSHFSPHSKFGCVGGNTVVGVKANGTIMACGFVPTKYAIEGNSLLDRPFLELWNHSENVKILRDIVPNETCRRCTLLSVCGGGCRANALLHRGALNAVDPYCFWEGGCAPDTNGSSQLDAEALANDTPFLSPRTIVTKCGSGTLL